MIQNNTISIKTCNTGGIFKLIAQVLLSENGKEKDITPTQAEDAKRLKAIYEAKKKVLGVTQQSIADELDITQGR